MKKIALLFLTVCVFVPSVFSTPLESLIAPAHAARLREGGGTIIETQLRNPVLRLLPQNDELRQHIASAMSALNPNIVVETLYLYRKPYPALEWSEDQRAALFNQMIALSTLTGTQYFSASRGAMRTFYEFSHVIDSPAARNPLPDPVFARPPESLVLYARQKDLTFGDNIYRFEFFATQNSFFFTQENITALTVGIIPAIGRNRLKSVMAVIDSGDSLLIYAVSMVRAAAFPGMGDRIGSSFGNRAEAILQWFTSRADEVFAELPY